MHEIGCDVQRTVQIWLQRKIWNNLYLPQNPYYNLPGDYLICPMGQKLIHFYNKKRVLDLVYISYVSVYQTKCCTHCPLSGRCFKGKRSVSPVQAAD